MQSPKQSKQPVAMQKKNRMTILLSVNAAAIVIAGVLIASAIWFNGGIEFRVVGERSDIVEDEMNELSLLESISDSDAEVASLGDIKNDDYISSSSHEYDSSVVPDGELWNESNITIYATPDIDICISGSLSNLGEMYWQTSNPSVISGFYNSARTWLGYDENACRYPVVRGIGSTTITAGTYDGKRKDSITVNVVMPPVDQWKHEVLTLVNKVRTKNSLGLLAWGDTCATGANIRAEETKSLYAHTRPDGTSWATVCPAPADTEGISGENLAIGNAAVSPATVVALWMGSEGHRANILNPEFTKLAVGFEFDLESEYKTYWSQFFSTY